MKATILPEQLTAIIDSREKMPLDLSPMQTEVGTLQTGDYSIKGLEHVVSVERKSFSDLLGCVGQSRARFDREVERLLAFPSRLLIVEATWADVLAGEWQASISTGAVRGSVLGWAARGLSIHFAGDHRRAGEDVVQFLMIVARRRWREARALVADVIEGAAA